MPTRSVWIIESRSKTGREEWKPVDDEKPQPLAACEKDLERWANEPGDQLLMFRIRNVTTGQIVDWPPADSR